jgi:hypothetical protein
MRVLCSMVALLMGSVAFAQSPPAAPATAPAAPAPATAGVLDGKTFTLMVKDPAKPAAEPDTLVFAGGTMRSAGCDQYGFTAAPYTTTNEAGAVKFVADAKSPKEGTNHWMGSVKGDAIEGTFVWSKAGQASITYTFTGTLKRP